MNLGWRGGEVGGRLGLLLAFAAVLALPREASPDEPPPAIPGRTESGAVSAADQPLYMGSGMTAPQMTQKGCVAANVRLPEKLDASLPSSVTVKFPVRTDGTPGAVEVLGEASPPALTEAIREAVSRCRWTPGLDAAGTPIAMWVLLPIRFTADQRQEASASASGQPSQPLITSEDFPEKWKTPEGTAFFTRVKAAVTAQWDPKSAVYARDPSGNRFLGQPRVTVVAVTLDTQGALADIKVARSSGVDFLDRLAVDAFQHSQPFGPPPAGLADEKGRYRFTFGFRIDGPLRAP